MNRRNFMAGAVTTTATMVFATNSAQAGCVPICTPGQQPGLRGTGTGTANLTPTLCTSDTAHNLMTVQWDGQRWIRLQRFSWYYGLRYANGSTEFYGTEVKNRRCWDRQSFIAGSNTRAVLWMNCLSREDRVTWTRYWFITDPIVDNGDYTLELYHTEPARSYEDAPGSVPAFRGLIG